MDNSLKRISPHHIDEETGTERDLALMTKQSVTVS